MFRVGPCRALDEHDVAVPFFIAPFLIGERNMEQKQNKIIWPAVAIICALIVATGVYLGLQDSQSQPTIQGSLENTSSNYANSKNTALTSSTTVYVTRTGECYHRGNCGYLRKSKIPMNLSQAKKRYRPCSKCSPPR